MDDEFSDSAMAIFVGDAAELTGLLTADPGLAARRSSVGHPTLLQMVACEAANLPDAVGSARALVAAGAPTGGPLVAAAGCGSREVLEFLLDGGVGVDGEDPRWTPLDEAIYWCNTEVVQMLLARGARVRSLRTAAGIGDAVKVQQFLPGGDREAEAGPIGSPFIDTVPDDLANDPQVVLDHAFVMAVNAGQSATAQQLLAAGAQVNAKPPGYHWKGTALHAAIWRGDRDLVVWLMAQGADPTIRDGMVDADADAAAWASHHNHPDLIPLLTP